VFVVDTNVLLYAADSESEFHDTCRQRVEDWRRRRSPWFLTWPICYEFLRVSTHPRVFRRPWTTEGAWGFLQSVLSSRSVQVLTPTAQHSAVLAEAIDQASGLRGNIMHDVHTVVLMREHGIGRIVTRDVDFHRFGDIEVVDPLG